MLGDWLVFDVCVLKLESLVLVLLQGNVWVFWALFLCLCALEHVLHGIVEMWPHV